MKRTEKMHVNAQKAVVEKANMTPENAVSYVCNMALSSWLVLSVGESERTGRKASYIGAHVIAKDDNIKIKCVDSAANQTRQSSVCQTESHYDTTAPTKYHNT